jgi:hypothetical protein
MRILIDECLIRRLARVLIESRYGVQKVGAILSGEIHQRSSRYSPGSSEFTARHFALMLLNLQPVAAQN